MTKEREALKLALEALEEAADAIDSWGSYASGYFQVKHDLENDISKAKNAITAIKEALAQPEQEPVNKYCCHFCFSKSGQMFLDRMICCPECGNKRCPKATSHELPCTNSNEPNQVGSIYSTSPQRKPLTDKELNLIGAQWHYNLLGKDDKAELFAFARAIEAAHGIKGEA